MAIRIPFDPSYSKLPARFFARVAPTPVRAPRVLRVNRALATELGFDPDALATPEGAAILSGNQVPEGADSIALAYAGHQFGHFVPQLGDGRAILMGEVLDRQGRRRDLQWKGSGRTPFSRGGDGRAALGPVLREYVLSEAMAALGIPTTRALAAVSTGEPVLRETVLPGAVITRVASSHLRVGTFQYFAIRDDLEGVRLLADYAIARHYPEAAAAEHPYRALLSGVVGRQAKLMAKWLSVGFVHGVMNTDNTSIAGETIDFGPCAFLDEYHRAAVFSSIDRAGRYAFGNQPNMAEWNLARFAETLLPLLGADEAAAIAAAESVLGEFAATFETTWSAALRAKLGLFTVQPDDGALVMEWLATMEAQRADFTLTFRALCGAAADPSSDATVRERFQSPAAFDAWAARWRQRLAVEPQSAAERAAAMRAVNPAIVPRNHLVEKMIALALQGDLGPFQELATAVETPFNDPPEGSPFRAPLLPEERVTQTFCGT